MKDTLIAKTKELTGLISNTEVDITVTEENNAFVITLQTADTDSFVGRDNERFEALSHLLKKILSKTTGDDVRIIIDVNNMRGKNDDALKAKASILAERARAFKKDIELDPMSSYERRVIHSFLENAPLVKTESVGEGAKRHLVIRYIENKETI